MPSSWTHLIRFVAVEDGQEHYGQPVDPSRDLGLDSLDGTAIKAYEINGDQFSGSVTDKVLTVQKLLAPLTLQQCMYIRCMGLNYSDHAAEAKLALPEVPVLFSKPRHALADPYPAPVVIPRVAQDGTSDYEAELAVVIGKTGKDIPADKAIDYILGFTACNDVSARKLQMQTSQWTFSKSFDGSCPIGPMLVSPSVLKDGSGLALKAIHNGNVVQDGNTGNMVFNVAQQIAFFSQGTTLEAGTLLITGTPAGVGFKREPPVVLRHGDDMRVNLQGVGTLVSKIVYEGQ